MNKHNAVYDTAMILNCDVRQNEPMSRHTTFKIGGAADTYVKVGTLSKLSAILKECRRTDTDCLLLGNGSNILVDDSGIRGAVIRLDGEFKEMTLIDDTTVYCGAGATLSALCRFVQKCALSGLEFAWGIPGTVGGAVFMNAGAYGGEMKDVVCSAAYIDLDGKPGRFSKEELDFGYRSSVFRSKNLIITGVTLSLKKDNPNDIADRMKDYFDRRSTKQPLEYPSAGSVFKRPAGNFAGALIEQCGLKGKQVGGAMVSNKHAGFIINKNRATAGDVKELIAQIKTEVKEKTGYELECEIIIL